MLNNGIQDKESSSWDDDFQNEFNKAKNLNRIFRWIFVIILFAVVGVIIFVAKSYEEFVNQYKMELSQIQERNNLLEVRTEELENKIIEATGYTQEELRKLWISAYKRNKNMIDGVSTKVTNLEKANEKFATNSQLEGVSQKVIDLEKANEKFITNTQLEGVSQKVTELTKGKKKSIPKSILVPSLK